VATLLLDLHPNNSDASQQIGISVLDATCYYWQAPRNQH
jgi:hypothetical protein